MDKLQELINERKKAIEEARKLNERLADGGLTDEKKKELHEQYKKWVARANELKEEIDREEEVALLEADNQRTASKTRPMDRGIDPTGGHGQPKNDSIPKDGDVRSKVTDVKEPETKFDSFGEQLLAIACSVRGGQYADSNLVKKLHQYTKEQRALNQESVPSDGGFLVQKDFVNEIYQHVMAESMLMQRCTQYPLGDRSNEIEIPAVDETSRASGSHYGGAVAYWIGEGDTITETDLKWRSVKLKLGKLAALVPVTGELLEDYVALGAFVENSLRRVMRWEANDAIINGSGVAKPLGVLNSNCLVSVSAEANQAATEIKPQNILKMYSRCSNPSRAEWYVNQDTIPALFTMALTVGTGGAPVMIANSGGLQDAPRLQMLARPINVIEHCKTLGTAGDIIFADFSDYAIIQKSDIKSARSIHVYFSTDKELFRFIWRLDGQPLWTSALTPANGSNTISPFVALATRS